MDSDITCTATFAIILPDLVVSAISIPNTTIIYGKTPWTWVSFTVKNQGAAPVTGVALQGQIVNMSRNGEPYSTGGYFNINYTDPLAPGDTATHQFAVGHDSVWPVGSYSLQVKVDHVNAVPESNENNNVSAPLSFTVYTIN
jgi:subtilase family serine protease